MNYFADIQMLRAIAVSGVFLHHAYIHFPGWVGVQLFFVISGVVVTNSWLRSRRDLNPIPALSEFYVKRAIRLVPSFITVCALYLLFAAFFPVHRYSGDLATAWREIIQAATLRYNYAFVAESVPGFLAPFWSLNVEEQFYLALPAVWLLLPNLQWRTTFLVGSFLAITCLIRPFLYEDGRSAVYFLSSQGDGLVLGVLLALYRERLPKLPRRLAQAIIATAVFAVFSIPVLITSTQYRLFGNTLSTLLNGLVVALALRPANRSSAGHHFFRRIGNWIGERSYSIYLVHFMCFQFYDDALVAIGFEPVFYSRVLHHNMGRLLIVALLTAAGSYLLHRFIEIPAMTWAKRRMVKAVPSSLSILPSALSESPPPRLRPRSRKASGRK